MYLVTPQRDQGISFGGRFNPGLRRRGAALGDGETDGETLTLGETLGEAEGESDGEMD